MGVLGRHERAGWFAWAAVATLAAAETFALAAPAVAPASPPAGGAVISVAGTERRGEFVTSSKPAALDSGACMTIHADGTSMLGHTGFKRMLRVPAGPRPATITLEDPAIPSTVTVRVFRRTSTTGPDAVPAEPSVTKSATLVPAGDPAQPSGWTASFRLGVAARRMVVATVTWPDTTGCGEPAATYVFPVIAASG